MAVKSIRDDMVPDPAAAPLDAKTFRQALGQFPTGVTIVTAMHGDRRIAMTANSFSSVSLEPPLVLWSAAKTAPSHDAFVAASGFAIHFLAADHQELALRFAGRGPDKFAELKAKSGCTAAAPTTG